MNQNSDVSDQNDIYDKHSSINDSAFECNICLDTARDAVVSLCGHLFCWPCLYQWLYATERTNQMQKTCPVCKSAISRDKTIPIYGRGGDETNRQDPRDKLPPRPAGQRTEVPNQPNFSDFTYTNFRALHTTMFGFGDGGFQMSFGIGSLPQYIISMAQELTGNDPSDEMEAFASRSLLFVGLFFVFLAFFYQ